jgi:signal transduction histidine kinase
MAPTVSLRLDRTRVADILPAALLVVIGLVTTLGHSDAWGALWVILVSLSLLWRRVWPIPVLLLCSAAVLAAGDINPFIAVASLLLAAFSSALYSRRSAVSAVLVIAVAVGIVLRFSGDIPAPPHGLGPFILLLPVWLAGSAIRERQVRADLSEARAARLEHESALMAEAAAASERARITRELHDVLAHNVSVMVVSAGAARQVMASNQEAAEEALLAVEATGREAMSELRSMFGLLQGEGDDEMLGPQPGLAGLTSLVERVRDAGVPVVVTVEGAARPLSVGLDLAAYRILQEALTNVLKHAPGARTSATVRYGENEIAVEVLNGMADRTCEVAAGRPEGSGRGLVGMRERVSLYGGRIETGPRPGGGFAVRAWLPLSGV